MKATRLSPFSHPPIEHKHFLALPKLRTLCEKSHAAIKAAGDRATALVPKAVAFLESEYQLVVVASKFTFEIDASPHDGVMRIPISPAQSCHEVRVNGVAAQGARIINGFMVLPPGTKASSRISADVFIGWPPPQVPHLIQYALALLIAHWLMNPQDEGKSVAGSSLHHIGQCVGFHSHPKPIIQNQLRSLSLAALPGSAFALPAPGGKA